MSEPKRNLKPGSSAWMKSLSDEARQRITDKRIENSKRRSKNAMKALIVSAANATKGTRNIAAALR